MLKKKTIDAFGIRLIIQKELKVSYKGMSENPWFTVYIFESVFDLARCDQSYRYYFQAWVMHYI